MVSSILLLGLAIVAYGVYNVASGLIRNAGRAKKSGLPYYFAPVSPINRIALLLGFAWLPLWKMLPRRLWEDTIGFMYADWQSNELFEPFKRLGDTFIVVSPGALYMYTTNAEVIHQITSKREAFPKPTESYKILAMYGDNVLTTEGSVWRNHRKITSASLNEKNNALVFKETIYQTEGLIQQWLGPDGRGHKTINSAEGDMMALMLHIIGYVGFGLKLLWPGQTVPADVDPKLAKYSSLEPPKGHSMNFKDSLERVLHHIMLLLLLPRWLLRLLPFEATKKAAESDDNITKYFDEFLQDKAEDVKQGRPEPGMDIMGMLVRTSYSDNTQDSWNNSGKGTKLTSLTDAEIIGNAFIMIVAGHETTANTIHFALLELAINPAAQRLVQKDVDKIFGTSDPNIWDYESSVNTLLASYVGATINETLRVLPPAIEVPKKVSESQDQLLTIDEHKHVLPAGMRIGMVVIGAHHNPRYWPAQPSKITSADTDVEDFVPQRWFRTQQTAGLGSGSGSGSDVDGADNEDYGGYAGPDTSAQLFRPARGSYIPFSDGARSCLGRRIAQVELIAALSVLFQRYSVELAVDEWVAGDSEVEGMDREQRRALYGKAQDQARRTLKTVTSLITLKLHGNTFIPVRLVPRGEERFVDWVE